MVFLQYNRSKLIILVGKCFLQLEQMEKNIFQL